MNALDFAPDTSALVVFSGGQDSTTCLGWALARFGRVATIGFDYGQRHAVGWSAAPRSWPASGPCAPTGPNGWATTRSSPSTSSANRATA